MVVVIGVPVVVVTVVTWLCGDDGGVLVSVVGTGESTVLGRWLSW